MKGKIFTFIIGLLIGAIITTAGFLVYNKVISNNSEQTGMMQMGGPNANGEEPPEKPDGDGAEAPPTMPEDVNSNTTSN